MIELTDQEIIESYKKTKSTHKTATNLGVSIQTVHNKLKENGVIMDGNGNKWTKEDDEKLIAFYSDGFLTGDGKLDSFAKNMNRTKQMISRKAKKLGLSNKYRDNTERSKSAQSEKTTKWYKENEHPKGFRGHKHSNESKKIISSKSKEFHKKLTEDEMSKIILKRLKTSYKNGTMTNERRKVTWKGGWREIGGYKKYYRSRWEANYARYLEWLKLNGEIQDWKHEEDVFWFEKIKRGVRSYLPDFKVTENNGDIHYHEVKGWMDAKSKTKLKRMRIYYPNIVVKVIAQKEYTEIKKKVSKFLFGWES